MAADGAPERGPVREGGFGSEARPTLHEDHVDAEGAGGAELRRALVVRGEPERAPGGLSGALARPVSDAPARSGMRDEMDAAVLGEEVAAGARTGDAARAARHLALPLDDDQHRTLDRRARARGRNREGGKSECRHER